jgi:hypothetical protein
MSRARLEKVFMLSYLLTNPGSFSGARGVLISVERAEGKGDCEALVWGRESWLKASQFG